MLEFENKINSSNLKSFLHLLYTTHIAKIPISSLDVIRPLTHIKYLFKVSIQQRFSLGPSDPMSELLVYLKTRKLPTSF